MNQSLEFCEMTNYHIPEFLERMIQHLNQKKLSQV